MLRTLGSLALIFLLPGTAAHVSAQVRTQNPPGVFSLGVAGVATARPSSLTVAAPLANLTNRTVADVKVDRIQLATAPVQTPLPIAVGDVGARSSVVVQGVFDNQSLQSGHRYDLVVEGTYRGGTYRQGAYRGGDGVLRRFRVRTAVRIPPPSEGSGQLGTVQLPPHKVEGGRYPPQKPRMDDEVNSGAPPVPTNPDVPGAPTPTSTEPKPAPR
jgi:hypothetical protein